MQTLQTAIAAFRAWQSSTYPNRSTAELSGTWECEYDGWLEIHTTFPLVLEHHTPQEATADLLDDMVYIIARDNEREWLIQETTDHADWFEALCRRSLGTAESDAKWQFAAYLPSCPCGEAGRALILALADDPDEYVCRRALLSMPALCPEQMETYAERFWHRESYAPQWQEYQRMAVLQALHDIHSPLLPAYLQAAAEDGRTYLTNFAKTLT